MESASGGLASEYYSGFNQSSASRPRPESPGSTAANHPARSSKSSKSSKSSRSHKSSKSPRSRAPDSQQESKGHRDSTSRAGGGLASEYYEGSYTSPTSNIPDGSSVPADNPSSTRPSMPAEPQSSLNATSFGAPAAALAAGVGVSAGAQFLGHQTSNQSSHMPQSQQRPSGYESSSMNMAHRRKRSGPFGKLVDFFRDPDGVGKFEEYTEAIGVCRSCFDPGSTPRNAPRKHHHGRHSSAGRGGNTRVDKPYRQYSSDEEKRRKSGSKKPWLAAGIAGYGLAKLGETVLNNKDFDDTYSVQSGRPGPSGNSPRRTQSRPSGRNETSSLYKDSSPNLAGPDRRPEISIRRDPATGEIYKERKPRQRQSSTSSSSSASSRNLKRTAAAGVGIAASESHDKIRGKRSRSPNKRYYHQRVSPRHSYLDLSNTGSRGQGISSFISTPSANGRKGKRPKGLFGFQYSSSSSDADLAFGEGSVRRGRSKGVERRRKDDRNVNSAILGLATTGVALAAASSAKNSTRRQKDVPSNGKERRNPASKTPDQKGLPAPPPTSSEDNSVWEDASEGESSENSALAYGARLSARQSRESLGSNDGTSKWDWRWNKSKPKKQTSQRADQPSLTLASRESTGPALDHMESIYLPSSGPEATGEPQPLRQLHPLPTSDPGTFDATRQDLPPVITTSSTQPAITTSSAPLHHPQPVSRVSPALYHAPASFNAPAYPPKSPLSSLSRSQTEPSIPILTKSIARTNSAGHDEQARNRSRRSSSPTPSTTSKDAGREKPSRRTSTRRAPPSVTFNLAGEQPQREQGAQTQTSDGPKERRSFLAERPEMPTVSDGAPGPILEKKLPVDLEFVPTIGTATTDNLSTDSPTDRSTPLAKKDALEPAITWYDAASALEKGLPLSPQGSAREAARLTVPEEIRSAAEAGQPLSPLSGREGTQLTFAADDVILTDELERPLSRHPRTRDNSQPAAFEAITPIADAGKVLSPRSLSGQLPQPAFVKVGVQRPPSPQTRSRENLPRTVMERTASTAEADQARLRRSSSRELARPAPVEEHSISAKEPERPPFPQRSIGEDMQRTAMQKDTNPTAETALSQRFSGAEPTQPANMEEDTTLVEKMERPQPPQSLSREGVQPTIAEEEGIVSTPEADQPPPQRWSWNRGTDVFSNPTPTNSPTAVPIHFRRLPVSPGSARSASFSGGGPESLPSSPIAARPRQGRPNSTEIRSKEFRPLYLVERHASSRIEPIDTEQSYPSLPSSRTSSAYASTEDLRAGLGFDDEFFPHQQEYIQSFPAYGRRNSYSYHQTESPRSPGFLDSRTATPTAFGSPQEVKKEKPKYEFHSPSELLQDPATLHHEQPDTIRDPSSPPGQPPKLLALQAFDAESLPPLPASRPSSPTVKGYQEDPRDKLEPRESPEKWSEQVPEPVPGHPPEKLSKEPPAEPQKQFPGEQPKKWSEQVPEPVPRYLSQKLPKEPPAEPQKQFPAEQQKKWSEQMPEPVPGHLPESLSKEPPAEPQKQLPREQPGERPGEQPREYLGNQSRERPRKQPRERSREQRRERPKDLQRELSDSLSEKLPKKLVVEWQEKSPEKLLGEQPKERPGKQSREQPGDLQGELPDALSEELSKKPVVKRQETSEKQPGEQLRQRPEEHPRERAGELQRELSEALSEELPKKLVVERQEEAPPEKQSRERSRNLPKKLPQQLPEQPAEQARKRSGEQPRERPVAPSEELSKKPVVERQEETSPEKQTGTSPEKQPGEQSRDLQKKLPQQLPERPREQPRERPEALSEELSKKPVVERRVEAPPEKQPREQSGDLQKKLPQQQQQQQLPRPSPKLQSESSEGVRKKLPEPTQEALSEPTREAPSEPTREPLSEPFTGPLPESAPETPSALRSEPAAEPLLQTFPGPSSTLRPEPTAEPLLQTFPEAASQPLPKSLLRVLPGSPSKPALQPLAKYPSEALPGPSPRSLPEPVSLSANFPDPSSRYLLEAASNPLPGSPLGSLPGPSTRSLPEPVSLSENFPGPSSRYLLEAASHPLPESPSEPLQEPLPRSPSETFSAKPSEPPPELRSEILSHPLAEPLAEASGEGQREYIQEPSRENLQEILPVATQHGEERRIAQDEPGRERELIGTGKAKKKEGKKKKKAKLWEMLEGENLEEAEPPLQGARGGSEDGWEKEVKGKKKKKGKRREVVEEEQEDKMEQEQGRDPVPEVAKEENLNRPVPEVAKQEILNRPVPEVTRKESLDQPVREITRKESLNRPVSEVAEENLNRPVSEIVKEEKEKKEENLNRSVPEIAKEILNRPVPEVAKQETLSQPVSEVAKQETLNPPVPEVSKQETLNDPVSEVAKQEILTQSVPEVAKEETLKRSENQEEAQETTEGPGSGKRVKGGKKKKVKWRDLIEEAKHQQTEGPETVPEIAEEESLNDPVPEVAKEENLKRPENQDELQGIVEGPDFGKKAKGGKKKKGKWRGLAEEEKHEQVEDLETAPEVMREENVKEAERQKEVLAILEEPSFGKRVKGGKKKVKSMEVEQAEGPKSVPEVMREENPKEAEPPEEVQDALEDSWGKKVRECEDAERIQQAEGPELVSDVMREQKLKETREPEEEVPDVMREQELKERREPEEEVPDVMREQELKERREPEEEVPDVMRDQDLKETREPEQVPDVMREESPKEIREPEQVLGVRREESPKETREPERIPENVEEDSWKKKIKGGKKKRQKGKEWVEKEELEQAEVPESAPEVIDVENLKETGKSEEEVREILEEDSGRKATRGGKKKKTKGRKWVEGEKLELAPEVTREESLKETKTPEEVQEADSWGNRVKGETKKKKNKKKGREWADEERSEQAEDQEIVPENVKEEPSVESGGEEVDKATKSSEIVNEEMIEHAERGGEKKARGRKKTKKERGLEMPGGWEMEKIEDEETLPDVVKEEENVKGEVEEEKAAKASEVLSEETREQTERYQERAREVQPKLMVEKKDQERREKKEKKGKKEKSKKDARKEYEDREEEVEGITKEEGEGGEGKEGEGKREMSIEVVDEDKKVEAAERQERAALEAVEEENAGKKWRGDSLDVADEEKTMEKTVRQEDTSRDVVEEQETVGKKAKKVKKKKAKYERMGLENPGLLDLGEQLADKLQGEGSPGGVDQREGDEKGVLGRKESQAERRDGQRKEDGVEEERSAQEKEDREEPARDLLQDRAGGKFGQTEEEGEPGTEAVQDRVGGKFSRGEGGGEPERDPFQHRVGEKLTQAEGGGEPERDPVQHRAGRKLSQREGGGKAGKEWVKDEAIGRSLALEGEERRKLDQGREDRRDTGGEMIQDRVEEEILAEEKKGRKELDDREGEKRLDLEGEYREETKKESIKDRARGGSLVEERKKQEELDQGEGKQLDQEREDKAEAPAELAEDRAEGRRLVEDKGKRELGQEKVDEGEAEARSGVKEDISRDDEASTLAPGTRNLGGIDDSSSLGALGALGSLGSLGSTGPTSTSSKTAKSSKKSQSRQKEAQDLPSSSTYDPVNEKGKERAREMDDYYDGYGEVPRSAISPTRPPSVRERRSMQQIKDLESRLDQLASENRLLAAAKVTAEKELEDVHVNQSKSDNAAQQTLLARDTKLQGKDEELERLRKTLDWMQDEVNKMTEVNEGLASANQALASTHAQLESRHDETYGQWQRSSRDLEGLRSQHDELSKGMEEIVRHEIETTLAAKNAELRQLYDNLEISKAKIHELQQRKQANRNNDILTARDEDYFDQACQQLCQHVQQWVLRFSKFSDSRVCKSTDEVRDEQIVERFDLAIVDGSEVDIYLGDRIRRRDVFMSVVMTMIWEFVFSRYLFGMDREHRQKLKQMEKSLLEVGPRSAVHRWRAITLTLLSRGDSFHDQRAKDTEAVAQEIFGTLARFLPPSQNLEKQILDSLRSVLRVAADLSIEMRTQCAEYIMLPPLKPEYTLQGDLKDKFIFNAALMNERSGETSSNEELQAEGAVVRMVLFPLVVKKGDDEGEGDEEVVVCPAQVLVAKEGGRKARKGKEAAARRMLSSDRMSIDQKSMRSTHSVAPSTLDMGNVI